jgi:hypothetical protein
MLHGNNARMPHALFGLMILSFEGDAGWLPFCKQLNLHCTAAAQAATGGVLFR